MRPPYRAYKHCAEETQLLFNHDGGNQYYRITRYRSHGKKPGPWYIQFSAGNGDYANVGDNRGYRTVPECVDAVNQMAGTYSQE
jgi:hypothetical protein